MYPTFEKIYNIVSLIQQTQFSAAEQAWNDLMKSGLVLSLEDYIEIIDAWICYGENFRAKEVLYSIPLVYRNTQCFKQMEKQYAEPENKI